VQGALTGQPQVVNSPPPKLLSQPKPWAEMTYDTVLEIQPTGCRNTRLAMSSSVQHTKAKPGPANANCLYPSARPPAKGACAGDLDRQPTQAQLLSREFS
jgi:hypothetical protein